MVKCRRCNRRMDILYATGQGDGLVAAFGCRHCGGLVRRRYGQREFAAAARRVARRLMRRIERAPLGLN